MSRAIVRSRIALVIVLLWVSVVAVEGGLAQEEDEIQAGVTPVSLGPAIPPELVQYQDDWPAPGGNLAATRDAAGATIDSTNVGDLEVAWTFTIDAAAGWGGMTATPLILGETVYVQDMQSNVFALDRATGVVKWEHRYDIPSAGPNGLAAGYEMLVGTIGDTSEVFALDARSGEEVWRVRLSNNPGDGIDMAPIVYDSTVYVSTIPGNTSGYYRGGLRGILYALDASTGATLWQFDTTTDNLWGNPRINGGGGVWYPPSFDDEGNIYFGTGNASPWPGITEFPNGASRPGDNDYASSIVSLDPKTGAVRWHHNAKPHDLFDLDFQNTPVLVQTEIEGRKVSLAIGSGKTGTVIAFDADTGEIVWQASVGKHQNDELAEIPPEKEVEVFPGILGGVETPIAFADGTVFVPIVNCSSSHTSTGMVNGSLDLTTSTGEFVALDVIDGTVKWTVDLPQASFGGATVANDVVFASGIDGLFRAYDTETGDLLWSYQAGAGFNASPALAGDMVIVGAAGPLVPGPGAPADIERANQVIAFKLGSARNP
jgi:glucose dehydrogenase